MTANDFRNWLLLVGFTHSIQGGFYWQWFGRQDDQPGWMVSVVAGNYQCNVHMDDEVFRYSKPSDAMEAVIKLMPTKEAPSEKAIGCTD